MKTKKQSNKKHKLIYIIFYISFVCLFVTIVFFVNNKNKIKTIGYGHKTNPTMNIVYDDNYVIPSWDNFN